MIDGTCLRCGAAFSANSLARGKRYCGQPCQQGAWRERNMERDQAAKRKWQDANREYSRKKSLAYYYATKDDFLAKQKVKYQRTRLHSPWKIIFNAARSRAAARKLPFDLTHDWIKARWTGRCEITDIPFVIRKTVKDSRAFSASIDRKDLTKGYTQDNCRVILQAVNAFKGEDTDEVMLEVAKVLVTKHRQLSQ